MRWLGSAFGLGLLPIAPGTFGTLLGVALAFLLPPGWPVAAAAGAVCLLGVPLAAAAERRTGEGKDPSWFVLDEVAGYLVAVAFVAPQWWRLLLGFALFRVFDIAKPWPIRHAERLPGGWGVMADDLVAALYVQLLLRLLP